MSIIISHTSALEWYRAVPPQINAGKRLSSPLSLAEHGTNAADLKGFDPELIGLARRPCHVLTSSDRSRSNDKTFFTHTTMLKSIPAGHAREIGRGLYVVSPELCCLQIAKSCDVVELVVLASELCGQYSHFRLSVSGFYNRPPLTSTDKLAQLARKYPQLPGSSKLLQALEFTLDGSASPMETVVNAMLMLPCSLGGRGLVRATSNLEVRLDDVASRITGTKTCRIDLGWHGHGVEYDGRASHQNPDADRRRREALAHMGYAITVIEGKQIGSYSQLKKTLDLVCADVPRRARQRSCGGGDERGLLERLMRLTRANLSFERLVFPAFVRPESLVIHKPLDL